MLINGKQPTSASLEELIDAIKALPSGFTERTRPEMLRYYGMRVQQAEFFHTLASKAFQKWENTKQQKYLQHSIWFSETAAKSNCVKVYRQAKAHDYTRAAQAAQLDNQHDKAATLLDRARKIHQDLGASEFEATFLTQSYRLLIQQRASLVNDPQKAAKQQTLDSKLKQIQARALVNRDAKGCSETDPNAYLIYQNEVGFSADRPIGTSNTHDCICLALRNPETHKTALLHLDSASNEWQIIQILKQLGTSQSPIQARLVGARTMFNTNRTSQIIERNRSNTRRLIKYLQQENIDILSADLHDRDQPTEILVDPKTFQLKESLATGNAAEEQYRDALCATPRRNGEIRFAFDLTLQKDAFPQLVRQTDLALDKRLSENWEQRLNNFVQAPDASAQSLANYHSQDCLKEQLSQSRRALSQTILKAYKDQLSAGTSVSLQDCMQAILALDKIDLYIGKDAEKANAPLTRFIQNKLFRTAGDKVVTDLKGLQQVKLETTAGRLARLAATEKQQARAAIHRSGLQRQP